MVLTALMNMNKSHVFHLSNSKLLFFPFKNQSELVKHRCSHKAGVLTVCHELFLFGAGIVLQLYSFTLKSTIVQNMCDTVFSFFLYWHDYLI